MNKADEALIKVRPDIKGINDLPLKSRYKILLWYGQANGNALTLGFPIADIQGRYAVLKSFGVYPYTQSAVTDFFVSDGVTDWEETIPALTRINRVFDAYAQTSTIIRNVINGMPTGIFANTDTITGLPLDLMLDNIFYLFDAKIQTWDVTVNAQHVLDLEAGTFENPMVKVVIECYLL